MADEQQATLRESIEDSIRQHSEPEPEVVAQPVEAAAPVETEQQREDRVRDDKGRFSKPAEQPVVAAKPAASVEPTAPVVAEPVVLPIQRPSSWKKEMWPLWDKMTTGAPLTAQETRQIAEYNAQRETQFATGVSTYKQIADSAKPLMDAIAPFQQDMEKHGIQAPEMVHRLMSAHKSLALGSPQQKLQMFSQLASQYGIPIQALYDQNVQQQYLATPHVQQPEPQQQPPNIEALIEQTLANREVQQTVASMAKDTQKYPFFNYVRNDMAQLLDSLEATDLHDAYQKAMELPQHSMLTTVQATQQAQAAEQQRVVAAQTTARVAKANAVSPRSATPAVAAAPAGKQGVRESLREAIALHAGGARF